MGNSTKYDKLLAKYFAGKLTEEEKNDFNQWRNSSDENQEIVDSAEKVNVSLDLLREMKQYNTEKALTKINARTKQSVPDWKIGILYYWQKVAAILLLPLILLSVYYFFESKDRAIASWQTISTPPGLKSQTQLADGTVVWLNSGSSLRYPSSFSGDERIVELQGEAYFSVVKDKKHPFIVETGKIGIKVLGTEFNVVNYDGEVSAEIVLASGKVELFEIKGSKRKTVTEMVPGQQVIYSKTKNQYSLFDVSAEKYTSWIDGKLIFRDDQMTEVIRRLNRWYNVEIEISDQEIAQYIYTATFQNENIEQILEMLRKTSPIEYTINPTAKNEDGSFGKQKIIIRKRI